MNPYSHQDYTGQTIRVPPSGEVIGSCFQQAEPDTEVFPPGTVATFIKCNLNNCRIPAGCKVVGGCNHQHREQNDGEEWILDQDGKPVKPLHHEQFGRLGLSIDPHDIPSRKLEKSVTETAEGKKQAAEEKMGLQKRIVELDRIIIPAPIPIVR